MMSHLQGGQVAAYLALAVVAVTLAFVLFWALTGWGVAIAVRSYRWAMRAQPRQVVQVSVVNRAALDTVPAGWDS
jgi:hypothetical protein